MGTCEPRQVRKEAALSKRVHVPQGCLARANCLGNVWGEMSKTDARAFFKKVCFANFLQPVVNIKFNVVYYTLCRRKLLEQRLGGYNEG